MSNSLRVQFAGFAGALACLALSVLVAGTARADIVAIGVLAFNVLNPGTPASPGINDFEIDNFTGPVFGLPPELPVVDSLWSLANYQFMAQLLGLAVLAKILNEQFRHPFRPRHGYGCPTLRAGRRPFCGRRVRSC